MVVCLDEPADFAVPCESGADSLVLVEGDRHTVAGAAHGYSGMLQSLAANGIVRSDGLFIAEMRQNQTPDMHPGWELCRDRTYGQTRLAVYRHTNGSSQNHDA